MNRFQLDPRIVRIQNHFYAILNSIFSRQYQAGRASSMQYLSIVLAYFNGYMFLHESTDYLSVSAFYWVAGHCRLARTIIDMDCLVTTFIQNYRHLTTLVKITATWPFS